MIYIVINPTKTLSESGEAKWGGGALGDGPLHFVLSLLDAHRVGRTLNRSLSLPFLGCSEKLGAKTA